MVKQAEVESLQRSAPAQQHLVRPQAPQHNQVLQLAELVLPRVRQRRRLRVVSVVEGFPLSDLSVGRGRNVSQV